jgi:major membrane immunogen (membrane-anchored lipoprotein)
LKSSTILVISLLAITIVLGESSFVFATSPNDYGGLGGTISGMVVSPSGNVVDWAQIHARSSNQTFEAFSGFSGLYLMRVPSGTYNVSVYDFYSPQDWAANVSVTVTDGSSIMVNFYLQAPPAPIQEFQPNVVAMVSLLSVAATCIMARRLKR